ncbi:MAG: TetR family transcriptional regulator [Alphaproteobacteria bacterium]|nr:TetR family transcriptional regulator [Alphaproteobacteria bacterium]
MTAAQANIGSDVRLIRAAEAELIANDGHVEMLAVAKRAGLSVGIAYHHFGSKAGLIAAVVDGFYGPLRDISFAGPTAGVDWATRERDRTRAFIDYFYDHPFAPLVVGRLGREPAVIDIESAHLRQMLDVGARNIRAGQKDGAIPGEIDADVAISFVLGGLWRAVGDAVLSEPRPSRKRLVEQAWSFVESALQARPPSLGAAAAKRGQPVDARKRSGRKP